VQDIEREDLEDALAAVGALGFAVRTPEQWRAHPQGRAVASLPLALGQAQPGPPRPLPAGRGAAGVRVLDLTRVIAGPVATRTLAAWGADVLRLDSPDLPEIPAQAVDTLPASAAPISTSARPRKAPACSSYWPRRTCSSRATGPERWRGSDWTRRRSQRTIRT